MGLVMDQEWFLRVVRKALAFARRVPGGYWLCEGRLNFYLLLMIDLPMLYSWLLPYLGFV